MTKNMPRPNKFWKRVAHLIFIIFISFFVVEWTKPSITHKKLRRFYPDMRHILLWDDIHGIKGDGQTQFLKSNCMHTNCYFTSNKSLFESLGYFDAILFSAQETSADRRHLPAVRSPIQKYVFVANDSADNYPICNKKYEEYFNWTWTYKMHSTLPYSHFTVHNIEDQILGSHFRWIQNMKPIEMQVEYQLSTKSKAAAIFLDKCKSRSKREVYIANLERELAKYNLEIDIYGDCGKKQCKRKNMAGCFFKLKKYYYFYLAMEDSIAPGYITKEILYGYNNYAIPVVYGGAEYSSYLPPNSYLNAMKLNEKMLAKEINKIIKDRSRFYDFFRWRNHYIIKGLKILNPCALCHAMNNRNWLTMQARNINFRKWWNIRYIERCAESRSWEINRATDKL